MFAILVKSSREARSADGTVAVSTGSGVAISSSAVAPGMSRFTIVSISVILRFSTFSRSTRIAGRSHSFTTPMNPTSPAAGSSV